MVCVVGAGPVGNYAAYLLAKAGFGVEVFEEHVVMGRPVQCTGIVTLYLKEVLKGLPKEGGFVVNRVRRTRVFSPGGGWVEIPLKDNVIVDRARFDAFLGEVAMSEGARYHFGARVEGCRRENGGFVVETKKELVKDEVVVGADGPFSRVAQSLGMYGERRFALGVQARMEMKEKVDAGCVDFFLGEGFFGWLVPEDEKIARVGIASYGRARWFFDQLVKRCPGRVVEWQSGPIPVYDPRVVSELDGAFLVGDAATQVKASTYGGILPGMYAAEELCAALKGGGKYARLWKRRIGRELWLHLVIRRVLDRFRDVDFGRLIRLVDQERVKRVITTYDREFPSRLLGRLVMGEPRLLRFLPRVVAAF